MPSLSKIVTAFCFLVAPVASLNIPATSKSITTNGRVSKVNVEEQGIAYQWSGVSFLVPLSCPLETITEEDPLSIELTLEQQETLSYKITCPKSPENNVAAQTRVAKPDSGKSGTYDLPLGSIPKQLTGCVLEVTKVSEQWECNAPNSLLGNYIERSPNYFHGFNIPDGCSQPTSPPVLPSRKIEFYGDSITCGYGNLVDTTSKIGETICLALKGAWAKAQDITLAYSGILPTLLDARGQVQCLSGIGITHSAPHIENTNLNMTVYEDKTLPCVDGSEYDFTDYKADLIVVDIGTNDYILEVNSPSDEHFIETYVTFVSNIMKNHKSANNNPKVLLVCGPMTNRQCDNVEIVSFQLSELFRDTKIGFVNVELDDTPFLHGCAGHPTVTDHQRMAEIVEVEAKKLMGW